MVTSDQVKTALLVVGAFAGAGVSIISIYELVKPRPPAPVPPRP